MVVGACLALTVLVGVIVATTSACDSGSRLRPELAVAVVGDSMTAGRDNRVVWPTLLGRRTGMPVANFALPDTGFVADGGGGHAFTHQVDRALAMRPAVVVIVCGQADNAYAGGDAIRTGVVDAVNKVKLAGGRVLVVGPTWYEVPIPSTVQSVSDAVREAAAGADVPFLDALDPPWLTPVLMARDVNGPNDDGQSVIADHIAAWLRTEVLT